MDERISPFDAAYALRVRAGLAPLSTRSWDIGLDTDGVPNERLFAAATAKISATSLRHWRSDVLERDDSQCVLCDSADHLHAHHIRPKALFPEMAMDVANGVTLCAEHHIGLVHGWNTFDLTRWQRFASIFERYVRTGSLGERLTTNKVES